MPPGFATIRSATRIKGAEAAGVAAGSARFYVEGDVGTLVRGTGDFTLKFGSFALGGIGTATFGAILLHALLRRGRRGLTAR